MELDAFCPGCLLGVLSCLQDGGLVDVYSDDVCLCALCHHDGDESGACAYVEDCSGVGVGLCPGSEEDSVGSDGHGAAVVSDGELFECEKTVCHGCKIIKKGCKFGIESFIIIG